MQIMTVFGAHNIRLRIFSTAVCRRENTKSINAAVEPCQLTGPGNYNGAVFLCSGYM